VSLFFFSLPLPSLTPSFLFFHFIVWSLTLRGEHRLRLFENRVLRRIFGPKRDEVTGEWMMIFNPIKSSDNYIYHQL
jgi:hypothetical protein